MIYGGFCNQIYKYYEDFIATGKTMKAIAIQVDEDIAEKLSKTTPEQRKRIESLFTLLVHLRFADF